MQVIEWDDACQKELCFQYAGKTLTDLSKLSLIMNNPLFRLSSRWEKEWFSQKYTVYSNPIFASQYNGVIESLAEKGIVVLQWRVM